MARDPSREVNFEEALREAHLVWADGRVSEDVRAVLDRVDEGSFLRDAIRSEMDVEGGGGGDGSLSGGGPEIPPHVLQFQLLVLALKRFLSSNDDYPPLEGTIPDMTSDTARYVALQEAYRRQAERDWSAVREIVGSLLGECERRRNGCDLKVAMPTNDEVQTFCKNSRYLRILETRPLFYEYELQDPLSPIVASLASTLPSSSSSSPSSDYAPLPDNVYAIQSDAREDLLATTMDPHETDPAQTPVLWWIALRACDAFYDRHGHYPGKHDQELAWEADANEVYGCMVRIAGGMGLAAAERATAELAAKIAVPIQDGNGNMIPHRVLRSRVHHGEPRRDRARVEQESDATTPTIMAMMDDSFEVSRRGIVARDGGDKDNAGDNNDDGDDGVAASGRTVIFPSVGGDDDGCWRCREREGNWAIRFDWF